MSSPGKGGGGQAAAPPPSAVPVAPPPEEPEERPAADLDKLRRAKAVKTEDDELLGLKSKIVDQSKGKTLLGN